MIITFISKPKNTLQWQKATKKRQFYTIRPFFCKAGVTSKTPGTDNLRDQANSGKKQGNVYTETLVFEKRSYVDATGKTSCAHSTGSLASKNTPPLWSSFAYPKVRFWLSEAPKYFVNDQLKNLLTILWQLFELQIPVLRVVNPIYFSSSSPSAAYKTTII